MDLAELLKNGSERFAERSGRCRVVIQRPATDLAEEIALERHGDGPAARAAAVDANDKRHCHQAEPPPSLSRFPR